jgi:hypothetical protein
VSPTPRASFNRQTSPCHPLLSGWRVAGVLGMVTLLNAGGGMAPVSAASQKPSVQSRETREALLSLFDQLGMGIDPADDTRSRANRRHPDVGFLSSDPICLSCVMTVLDPPALSPTAPRQPLSPPVAKPTSSPPLKPALQPATQALLPKPPTILQSRIELPPIPFEPESLPGDPVIAPQAPIQTPGPLSILGFGTAFGFSRRLRRRLKPARRQQPR